MPNYIKNHYTRLLVSTYPKRLAYSRRRLTGALKGEGLEIGPGNLPMAFKHKVKMQYLDSNTQDQLAKYYPHLSFLELQNFILGDADDLIDIPNNRFDFLIASHVIEHVKNPLKAFKRWVEVVKPGGYLYLIFPNRDECFDKGRPYTTIKHLLSEYPLENDSRKMFSNLTQHIRENYINTDKQRRPEDLSKEDIIFQVKIGSAHYHVWGPKNTHGFFQTAIKRLNFSLQIAYYEHKFKELRYLILKKHHDSSE